MPLDRSLLDLATAQGGVLTRVQLLEAGHHSTAIERDVAAGRLIRIKKGIYRALDLRQHDDLLRAAVVSLPNATVSHESAAHLLRFPVLPPLRPTVTVHSKTTHTFPGVTVRRSTDLRPNHILRVDGLPVTNVLRTLFDLAAVLDERLLDAILEALLIAGRVTVPDLTAFARSLRRRGKPGATAIDIVLAGRQPQDATALERLGLDVLRRGGVPSPVLQHPAPWNDQERIDAAWPPALVGVEWDSRAWHSSVERMANDRRRDREASLAGWVILRYTWHDLTSDPERVADEVLRLLTSRSPSPRR